jgi:hypothetical protein
VPFQLDPLSPSGISKVPNSGITPYFAGGPGKPSLLDSVNGKHGAVRIEAGSNVTIDNTEKDVIRIASSGGGDSGALNDLTDVDTGSATNGQTIIYNEGTSTWQNGAAITGAFNIGSGENIYDQSQNPDPGTLALKTISSSDDTILLDGNGGAEPGTELDMIANVAVGNITDVDLSTTVRRLSSTMPPVLGYLGRQAGVV